MNKQRRKEIYAIIARLNKIIMGETEVDLDDDLNDIISDIELLKSEEEDYMDNMPENLHGGYRYEMAEEACLNFENAIDSLNDAIDNADDFDEMMNSIKESIDSLNDASM